MLIPICISITTKNDTWSFTENKKYHESDGVYSTDSNLILAAIISLMKPTNDGKVIYVHNLAKFDGIYLINALSEMTYKNIKVKPLINNLNNKIMSIDISWTEITKNGTERKYNLYFHDSFLLLPASLRKLAITFNVLNKGHFPFDFMNSINNPLKYIGKLPEMKYFKDITTKEYNELSLKYKNNDWNLMQELVNHCENDTKTLRLIMEAYNNSIYGKFSFNIHDFATAPSLSYYICLACFLSKKKDVKVPIITGKLYNFIKQAYKGGHTELYIPEGHLVKQYDVNAMYPNQMATQPMPCGKVQYFKGNIFEINPNAFGFFLCDIEAPENLDRPILLTRVKVNGKYCTIAPLGKWQDVLFSEEIKNAIKVGYKITPLEGYTYENVLYWNKIKEANKFHTLFITIKQNIREYFNDLKGV